MTILTLRTENLADARAPSKLLRLLVLELVETWLERVRQRHELAGLSDAMLKDIGVSRVDAVRETSKPFWQG